ncbi:MAG: hypothetical protein ABIW48_06375 [Burkholderiales bacterium]
MKMLVTWLFGVPLAVMFFFAAFAVDASKISPQVALIQANQSLTAVPTVRSGNSELAAARAN